MKTWSEYYRECKEVYQKETGVDTTSVNVYDLLCKVATKENNFFNFDDEYYRKIQKTKVRLDDYFSNPAYHQRLGPPWALGLKDTFLLEKELGFFVRNYFRSFLEREVFGCYIRVDNAKVGKTCTSSLSGESSWEWHFDNNPLEQLKIMIYFNDVSTESGAFRILEYKKKGMRAPSSRIDTNTWENGKHVVYKIGPESWRGSRVPPDVIKNLIREGCEIRDIESPAGTAILFDNNIVHKGTIPQRGYRYAAILQFKPIHYRLEEAFGPRVTGNSEIHTTFNMDPELNDLVERSPKK